MNSKYKELKLKYDKYKWQIWGVMVSGYLQSFMQGFARSLDQLKV